MVKEDRRNIIAYIPYSEKAIKTANTNEYTANMVKILKERYKVTGKLASPIAAWQMLRTRAVFLNWIEEIGLSKRMKFQIMLYKLLGADIIWVFHNRYPHDAVENRVSTGNMNWLATHSTIIMAHSKSSVKYIPDAAKNRKKAVYVPHIKYAYCDNVSEALFRKRYKVSKEDFVFTMFGVIRPYKKLEIGIEAFKRLQLKDAKLIITGGPVDLEYTKQIIALCKGNDNIILDLHYLPERTLSGLIEFSDVILVPYQNRSSINSGVVIRSFSQGTTVIAPDICMVKDLAKNNFLYMYKDSPDQVMAEAYKNGKALNKHMGAEAREYMNRHNSEEIVKRKIYGMLK